MVRRIFVSLALVSLLAAGTGFAATTGRIAGKVLDNDGLALPGVTVQISSPQLIGGPQIAIADVDGGFSFNLLPPGTYTVEATLAGFQPAAGQVQVQLDRVAGITFNMVPEQFGGEIEVTAEVPVVDTTQVNTSQVFNQDYLEKAAIGSGGRDYLSIISTAAGVVGTGNASVYGGTEGDNAYLVDGLNTTDPLLGTFGTNFNYDAIQEVNFQTGGFEAEFGQATGGIVNLVTKSGGNEFSGSLDIRYRNQDFTESGDHYDPKNQESQTQNVAGTLGGPILRDRVWFFASVENVDNKTQGDGWPTPWNYKGWNYIGKVTWQVTDSHRAVLKYSGDPAKITGANAGTYTAASGARTQEQGGDIYQGELNSVLTESLLLNAQVGISRGYIKSYPGEANFDTSAHINGDTGVQSHSIPFSSFDDRDRDEYRLNATWFVDQFAGSHEFKAGAEYNKLFYGGRSWINGGGYFTDTVDNTPGYDFIDLNGDGYFNQTVQIKEPEATARNPVDSDGNITTFFVQDAWRPIPNLTFKPGVRLDNVKMSNAIGEDVADMDSWQPRVGFAWDLFGDARHVIRGSYGRFMDPTALSIPNFASGVTESYHDYNTLEYYCNATRGLYCTPDALPASWVVSNWTNGEGIDYVLIDNLGVNVYEPAATLDQLGYGNLKAPYADEYILAYETQLAPQTSLELTYVNKETKDIIEDTCGNNTWAWGDGTRPSLDDPSTWTSAAGCTRFVITNHSDFYRKYEGYILKFETRQDWVHILASWTNSESTGNTFNGARESYATELADYYPVHFVNRDGYAPDHRENRLKLNGYFLLPYDITLGFDGFWSSQGHLTPVSTCDNMVGSGLWPELEQYCTTSDGVFLGTTDINLASPGSVKTPSTWQLDLQVSKSFSVGSVDLTPVLTVINVFGQEKPNAWEVEYLPSGQYDIGQAYSWRLPRRYELGFRVEF